MIAWRLRLQLDEFVLHRSMQCAILIASVMTAVTGCNAVPSSPDPIADSTQRIHALHFFSKKVSIVHHHDSFAKSLVAEQMFDARLQATLLANLSRCNKAHCTFSIRLHPHIRLAVVDETYWRAILHKDKLIEFCSSKHSTMLDACSCLLAASLSVAASRQGCCLDMRKHKAKNLQMLLSLPIFAASVPDSLPSSPSSPFPGFRLLQDSFAVSVQSRPCPPTTPPPDVVAAM